MVARIANQTQARDARLKRLAGNIDALAEKDEGFLRRAREVAALRQAAAADIYAICADFVASVNRLLARTAIELDPPGYDPNSFQEDLVNLMQINVRGRILQISFSATPELVSTEDFRVPYTLAFRQRNFPSPCAESKPRGEPLKSILRTYWGTFSARAQIVIDIRCPRHHFQKGIAMARINPGANRYAVAFVPSARPQANPAKIVSARFPSGARNRKYAAQASHAART